MMSFFLPKYVITLETDPDLSIYRELGYISHVSHILFATSGHYGL